MILQKTPVLYAEKVQEIAPVGYVNISETSYEQVKDYHGFGFTKGHEQTPNGMDTYVLKGFDDRLVAHGSDFDLNAPLKSQQAAQDAKTAAKPMNGGAALTRKGTSMNPAGGPPPSAGGKRPAGGNRATLATPGSNLARNNSFNTLNIH